MREPEDCRDMAELRAAIDGLDRELVALLARRMRFIDRAAALKGVRGMPARIDDRVEEVVANARAEAARLGYDADLTEQLWRTIVEWSIAREERVLGRD